MRQYQDLLRRIVAEGSDRGDRTGVGTRAVFGHQMRFDLRAGFPAVTTKQLYFRSVVHELLWFLRGDTNVAYLHEHNVHIWDDWADPDGSLGPVYGHQWRHWATPDGGSIDQIAQVVSDIQHHPESRRLVVSAWNVADLPRMKLPPCHVLFQFHVSGGRLSCQVYQRSGDVFLGVPFNLASYALLTSMIAHVTGLGVGDLVHTLGDAHVYTTHRAAVDNLLSRDPLPLPTLALSPAVRRLEDFTADDIQLTGYKHHPAIRAPIAV